MTTTAAAIEHHHRLDSTWAMAAMAITLEMLEAAPGTVHRFWIHDPQDELAAIIDASPLSDEGVITTPMIPGPTPGTASPAPYMATSTPLTADTMTGATDRLHTALQRSHKSITEQG